MRTVARIFMVLFCLTFLANQAHSYDSETLTTITEKLTNYTVQGLAMLQTRLDLEKRSEALLTNRVKAIETHLEQSGFVKIDQTTAALEFLGALAVEAEAWKKFEEASNDLIGYLNSLQ